MSKIYCCLSVCTRHEEECSLLILFLVDAMHFLKHCPLVFVTDKRYIYLFPFQFITWTACFPGSDTGRIEMRFLSTVPWPWCLLQLSNHSPFIKHMMFYYLSRLLCWIRHGENQNTILKHRPLVRCLLQISNRIHVVHSSTIRYTLELYITPCLSSGRAAEHSLFNYFL